MNRRDRLAATVRKELEGILAGAVGTHRVVLAEQLERAGYAPRHAQAIAAASRRLETDDEATATAAEWGDRIADELAALDSASPAELAAFVPRY